MKLPVGLAAFSIFATSMAFAQEPPAPPAPPPSTLAADASPEAAAAATAKATDAKAAAAAKAATDAEIKTMRNRGYKPVNRNGTLVYCRAEGQIGTHFQKERCNTMDELKQAELTGKEYVKSIQQQGSPTEFKADVPGGPTH